MSIPSLASGFTSVYFSRLLDCPVETPDGRLLGRVKDLIAVGGERPRLAGCLMRTPKRQLQLVSWEGLSLNEEEKQYQLLCRQELPFAPPAEALFLNRQVLDKQIVDINGKKLVRVNDIRLTFLPSGAFPIAVDVGLSGLFRRLGLMQLAGFFYSLFNKSVGSRLILWKDIGVLPHDSRNIKLSVAYSKLNTLHPSDLSDIIEDLDAKTRNALFNSLDEEKAADVLEEMEDRAAVSLVKDLPVGKVADVLEKMPPDEVADILDDLNKEKAEELLSEMDQQASNEVRELMEYPEDSAGALMNTDLLAYEESCSAGHALAEIKRLRPEPALLYAIYVVNAEHKLTGTVSLRDLLLAEEAAPLAQFMHREPLSIRDDMDVGHLTEPFSKYNLLAVPVVDKMKTLVGSIVIDDIFDQLLKYKKLVL